MLRIIKSTPKLFLSLPTKVAKALSHSVHLGRELPLGCLQTHITVDFQGHTWTQNAMQCVFVSSPSCHDSHSACRPKVGQYLAFWRRDLRVFHSLSTGRKGARGSWAPQWRLLIPSGPLRKGKWHLPHTTSQSDQTRCRARGRVSSVVKCSHGMCKALGLILSSAQ
jgi:hypothetical protein